VMRVTRGDGLGASCFWMRFKELATAAKKAKQKLTARISLPKFFIVPTWKARALIRRCEMRSKPVIWITSDTTADTYDPASKKGAVMNVAP